MKNFERIKNLSVEEMAKFIDNIENYDSISYDFCTHKMCGCKCDEDDDCSFNCGFSKMVEMWLNHEETNHWESDEEGRY